MKRRFLFFTSLLFLLQACGGGGASTDTGADGGSGSGSGSDAIAAWIGTWVAVSENGAPASGQLTLTRTSFNQTSIFTGGSCTWSGSVSNTNATTITLTTNTASGTTGCENALGRTASPMWSVDANRLTLDYSGAVPLGTVQVWQRL